MEPLLSVKVVPFTWGEEVCKASVLTTVQLSSCALKYWLFSCMVYNVRLVSNGKAKIQGDQHNRPQANVHLDYYFYLFFHFGYFLINF